MNVPAGIEDSLATFSDPVKEKLGLSFSSSVSTEKSSVESSSCSKGMRACSKLSSVRSKNVDTYQIAPTTAVSGFQHRVDSTTNAFIFNESAFDTFMRANKFTHMIRSHTVVLGDDGFDLRFANKCVTVYSCSNVLQHIARLMKRDDYKNEPKNECTVAFVDGSDSCIRMIQFDTKIQ